MRVSHSEGVANHTGPESWRCGGNALLQALTGEQAGWVLSREIVLSGVPTTFVCAEGYTGRVVNARREQTPRGRRPHARLHAPCAEPGRSRRRPRPVGEVRAENPKGTRPR